jgi:PAS domain S-box-containing protein
MAWMDRWWNLRLRTKGLLAIAVPATATVAIACASYVIGNYASEAEQRVEWSLRTSAEIQRLRASETEIRAAVRAYLITKDENFTVQTRAAMASFDSTRERLLSLTQDNPVQRKRLNEVESLERSRTEEIFALAARFRSGALAWTQLQSELLKKEAERLKMDAILESMEEDEKARIETGLLQVDSLRAELRAATAFCMVFGVGGGIAISLLFGYGITNRIRTLERNVARLATGEIPEVWPCGLDEIGTLSDGMRQTAEVLRRKASVLENALHGIVEVDGSGRCVSFNKAFSELAGFPEREGPASIAESVHSDDRNKVEVAVRSMRATGGAEVEVRLISAQGTAIDAEMTFLPALNSASRGYFVFVRDIRPVKQAEAALIRAKDAAVTSNAAKTGFLAKITHDIRTPLNAILGAADLLSTTPLDGDQSEYVRMFQRNSRRLVSLINDFLDFSRIEAGAIRVERAPFQIRETVEDAVATFRELALRKGIVIGVEIDHAIPAWVFGDGFRVQQVLVNLLSNAIKFTSVGRVDVNVAKSDDRLRFEVTDSGPGIPAEDQGRIFSAFTQLGGQRSNGMRGSGLGLAICRELVELLEGEIGVESMEKRGSSFYFSLPLEPALPGASLAEPARSPAALSAKRRLKILVVEDAEDTRLLLEHYLRCEPIEVEFAVQGQDAVDLMKRGREFDLILMDIDLPGINGYEATRMIRSWEKEHAAPPVPIVALSAHAMEEAVRESLDAGCVAHVAKPVNRPTLIEAIRTYARPKRVRHDPEPEINDEVRALIPKYLASKPAQIEEARNCLVSKDFDGIQRFGHNLKGTGTGYGFPRIGEIGKEIEQAAVRCDETTIARELEALDEFVTHVPVDQEQKTY